MNTNEEVACLKCGGNEFKLTRTAKGQILAECSKCGYPHLMEGVSIFWNPEDEEGTAEKEKPEVMEVDQQKIPKEIEEKPVEELANEMIEFISKESLDDAPFHEISRIFWNKKGLDFLMFPVEPAISLKRLRIERIVRERLPAFQGDISPKQVKKEKELLDSLKSKVLVMARRDNKKSLTQTDIEFYLMENEEALPRRLQRILYHLVNSELAK